MNFILLSKGMKKLIVLSSLFLLINCSNATNGEESNSQTPENISNELVLGSDQLDILIPKLKDRRVSLLVNHSALVGKTHLVDTLLSLGINIVQVFAPEHGFRGQADAGEKIKDGKDSKTGIQITSLYGSTRKPTAEMLEGTDVVIYDIQDIGIRFFTFISSMHYVMEACAENGKKFIVLDRPNPNGSYADGPIRQDDLKSFVGMHPIPIVHGLTVGELAEMINGEGWLEGGIKADLEVIKMKNYTHSLEYPLPTKPSPNLPTDLSIALYPSVCLFEGTTISVGRGTYDAFQQIGHPTFEGKYEYSFTPESIDGMAKNPKYLGQACYGIDLRSEKITRVFTLKYLIEFYNAFENKEEFFNNYIDKLAGTTELRKQIVEGMSEEEIRATWEPALGDYKKMKEKYRLYPQ